MRDAKRDPRRTVVWLSAGASLLLTLTMAGCWSAATVPRQGRTPHAPSPQSKLQAVPPRSSEKPTTTQRQRSSTGLSPRQMAGQRIIYGYPGLTPPADLLWLIRHGEAAGVIFFSDNISSRAQLKRVTATLERANASRYNPVRAPLLLMTDQEGGRMRRLPGGPSLSEKQIGTSEVALSAAAHAGTEAGRNLRDVGLNVNLAPVLDVYRSAGDFDDQYGRSYSSNPEEAAELGAAFIRAQQRAGVAATAKHFPGLGSAAVTQDTDRGSVTLENSSHSLTAVDELPFREAVASGVKLIMVSWAVYPALDPRLPAGLSPVIVKDVLRDSLGFEGVVISDGMVAGGVQAYGPMGKRAHQAAKAGLDLLVCSKSGSSVSVGRSARDALLAGYVDGSLPRAEFEASVRRVIALRQSLGTGAMAGP